MAALPNTLRVLQDTTGGAHLFVSSGGTGLSPHDVTVQAISPLLEKQATGIIAGLVSKCVEKTPFAMLSNPLVGRFLAFSNP